MDGVKANLVLSDPPYNVDVEETAGKIMNDNMGDSEFYEFLLAAFTICGCINATIDAIYERIPLARLGIVTPTPWVGSILKRTYHRDGTADTDMYFDANGNPKALSKGQYGIRRSGYVNLLLDKNGNIMLCVDNLLNGFPCMVVVFGCVVCLLMIVLPKSLSVVLTIVYVAFILYETLMFRESGDARTNFVLFSYAGKFLKEQSVRVGVINNIWLFIPLGAGLYRWFQKKWVLLIPFVMSVAIETTQYIMGLGIAEFDDVFGNTMGGWIGVLVAWTWLSRKMSVKNRA